MSHQERTDLQLMQKERRCQKREEQKIEIYKREGKKIKIQKKEEKKIEIQKREGKKIKIQKKKKKRQRERDRVLKEKENILFFLPTKLEVCIQFCVYFKAWFIRKLANLYVHMPRTVCKK